MSELKVSKTCKLVSTGQAFGQGRALGRYGVGQFNRPFVIRMG